MQILYLYPSALGSFLLMLRTLRLLPSLHLSQSQLPSQSTPNLSSLRIKWDNIIIHRRSPAVLLKTEKNLYSLPIFNDLWVALGEVPSVLIERPVAAEDVDDRQGNLVECVVKEEDLPVDTLLFQAEVDLVEDYHVDQVHGDCYT